MLGTIKVPLNMKQLQVNLPKSQYDNDKQEKMKKEKKKDFVLDDKEHNDRDLQKIQEEVEYDDEKVPPPPRSV
jgi:hypothetical protein